MVQPPKRQGDLSGEGGGQRKRGLNGGERGWVPTTRPSEELNFQALNTAKSTFFSIRASPFISQKADPCVLCEFSFRGTDTAKFVNYLGSCGESLEKGMRRSTEDKGNMTLAGMHCCASVNREERVLDGASVYTTQSAQFCINVTQSSNAASLVFLSRLFGTCEAF